MSREDRKCHSKWRIIIIPALTLNVSLLSGPDDHCANISNDAGITDTLVSVEFEVIATISLYHEQWADLM